MHAEAAHRDGASALTRFIAFVAQFGRFLPRLGPFGFRTAFLYLGEELLAAVALTTPLEMPEF